MAPLTGDLLIIQLVDGTFSVSVVQGKHLGRTNSAQEALALACNQRRGCQVWLSNASGHIVPVDCRVEPPHENPSNT